MTGLLGRNDRGDDEGGEEEDDEPHNGTNNEDSSSSSSSSSSSDLPTPTISKRTRSKAPPLTTTQPAAPIPSSTPNDKLSQSPIRPRQLNSLKKPPFKIDKAKLQAKVNKIRRYKRQSRRFLESESKKLHDKVNRSSTSENDNTVATNSSSSSSNTSDSNYKDKEAKAAIDNAKSMKTSFQHWSPDTIGPRS